MRNLNPVFENILLAPSPSLPGQSDLSTALQTGIGYTIGIGSKVLKDNRTIKMVIAKYPTPMSLKEKLMRINTPTAQRICGMINQSTTMGEYKNIIRRYICKGTFLRYLLHGYGHVYSAAGNALDALANNSSTADDIIANNI